MPWKHLGTSYEILSRDFVLNLFSADGSVHKLPVSNGQFIEATFQCSRCVENNSKYAGPVIVYTSEDGKVWMRPRFEFYDGRFEEYGNSWSNDTGVADNFAMVDSTQ